MKVKECREALTAKADPDKVEHLKYFFKTGPGQYGEGDMFLGITVPANRQVVKMCTEFDLDDITLLLDDPYHEVRLLGGLLLERMYDKHKERRDEVVDFYVKNLPKFNNWDLIDLTCYKILGHYLIDQPDRKVLYDLARSENMWEQRAAIVSTMAFVRNRKNRELDDTYAIAEMLLDHTQDLMHKAVGWLLREAGKEDRARLDAFLGRHYDRIPRTALRYAIEKHPEQERKAWLNRKF